MFRIIRRIFWSFIALLVFWCAWSLFSHRMPWQKGKKTTNELKVLTYNTHAMMIGESLDSKLAMLQYINRLDADIVCLQEVLVYKSGQRLTLPMLREAMRQYPYTYYDFKHYNSRRQFGNVVFSRYPLIHKQTIRYESASNISSQCDVVVGADTLRLVVNHLESFKLEGSDFHIDSLTSGNFKESSLNRKLTKTSQLRRKQVQQVRSAIRQSPYPAIAVGDFNAVPLSLVYWTMNLGMRDCFAETSVGRYGATYQRKGIGIRIDYIFCSRELVPLACRTEKKHYSDHYPVVATIGW
ncbi:MAG: endonuclease/exonuclease/phosphatase family protein [Paludibacteraceae bacterium]|nr:endonuclease/exonuclease/phosphatase family protein [Paludibacteraceae bacterium]